VLAEDLRPQIAVTEFLAPEYLEYYRMLPLEVREGVLLVAGPSRPPVEVEEDLLELFTATRLDLVETPQEVLSEAISRTFAAAQSSEALIRSLGDSVLPPVQPDSQLNPDARDLVNQPPVVRYVSLLIREAHEAAASDIHLEATEGGTRVRLRIDGVLGDQPSPPRHLQAAILTRIKLLAQLDIASRRTPQDGRIRIRLDHGALDLRVATLPTAEGETVTLRLLDHGGRPAGLEELGMPADILAEFRRLVERPNGTVFVTGPTGSGKTTTLYAALGLRDPKREKVITVEDPVEYRIEGVVQIAVNADHGMSFASALRSILRHDPDVLLVGETRDSETARIAIQSAMTGHLVLSSLHTNDSASALPRLADLGIEPYLLAATIDGVLAQRLVRRICDLCRESYEPDRRLMQLVAGDAGTTCAAFQRGVGCASCRQTGYRGRVGVFELLVISDEMRTDLAHAPDAQRLRRMARLGGMRSLREDAWDKVRLGVTTVEEVARALGV
jgi:type II secretory ATPase GspE/PulE/Tfp pilus assembly ATPase PilB-like protein